MGMCAMNEFLLSYNRIHDVLRELAGDSSLSFSRALCDASRSYARVSRVKDELDEYRMLRNAIVHDSTHELIAIPCKSTVERIEAIEQMISRPASLISRLPKRRVFTVSEHNSLASVLRLFSRTGCSQFPIVTEERISGIISTDALSFYLSRRITDAGELLVDLGTCSVGMVMDELDHREVYGLFAATIDVYEALKHIRMRPSCRLWLITPDGGDSERILNVCNGYDLPGLLEHE